MNKRFVLSLIILLSLGCAAFQRAVFYGQNVTVAPAAPIYSYVPSESGFCSSTSGDTNCLTGSTNSVSTQVNTTNGDLVIANCQRLNAVGTQGVTVTDAQGESWIDEADLTPNNGATGTSSGFVALIANGASGDEVDCTTNFGGTPTSLSMTIDGFHSSTGWKDAGDGTPTDQATLHYVLASPAGPCTVTASGASSQANELVYGSCFATVGTVSSASGYTTAQNNTFTSIGQVYTAFKSLTSSSTPSFVTNGTLTDPQSLILTFEPN